MSAVLREELQRLRVMELHQRAKAAGVDAGLLEDAMDSVQPKEPLVELLVARQGRDTAQRAPERPEPQPAAKKPAAGPKLPIVEPLC